MWTIISREVIIRWMASPTEFQPAPHVNGVRMPVWRLVMLGIVKVVSTIVLAGFLYCCVAKPLYPRRELTLDAKFIVIGLIALVSDGFLNGQQYIFAWNSYAANRGNWAAFVPFHNADAPTHYTESLLWGPSICVSFCAGVAIVGCQLFRSLPAPLAAPEQRGALHRHLGRCLHLRLLRRECRRQHDARVCVCEDV